MRNIFFKIAILFYLIVPALTRCSLQRDIMFPIKQIGEPPPVPAEISPIWIDTEQGKIELWFLPGHNISKTNPGPAIIYAHGNAELIDFNYKPLAPYRQMGISLVLCEYRGYGRSAGTPSQEHIITDFVKCYDTICKYPEVDSRKIFFHGRSIGTGVVCALSVQRKPAAIILQSPFISTIKLARDRFSLVTDCLIQDPFNNEDALKIYPGPVLIMHGLYDAVIPFQHSEYLNTICANCTFIEYNCGHNDFPLHSPAYWNVIETFLKKLKY